MALDFEVIEQNILGGLKKIEAEMLYKCAVETPLNRILELGSFIGKSTAVLAMAMKERQGVVIACDLFLMNQKHWGAEEQVVLDTLKTFWANLDNLELSRNVLAIKGNHSQILPMLSGKFGMVYIDGGHTIQNIIPSSMYAWNNTVEGGFIIFHDYENEKWEDIKICVDVLSIKWNRKFDRIGSLVVFVK